MTNEKTMIKFFRKIRQKLLSENKFSKYLIYAIGEIILVVIGILIALQINNWNEGEKLKKEEIKILQNFEKSLNEDLTRTEWVTEQYLLTKNSISILINHLEQNLPYNDSLNTHFGRITQTWTPRINTEVFETLKSINLNLISKENLRNEIVQYYSYSNNILNNDIDRYVNTIENASKNIFNTRFNALWNGNYVK